MKATEILMEEHRVIERVLNALEKAASRLKRGENVYLRFFNGTSVFIRDFVDNCHYKKEDRVLLPALIKNGLSKDSDSITAMLEEHEEGRRLTQKLRQAIDRFQAGDLRARDLVIQCCMEYVKLLRAHISKEEKVLFPVADQLIPADEQDQINKTFERFQPEERGEEFHEKYYGFANRLVQECIRTG
jgi:hemerythrin-like domain-containing protein